MLDCMVRVVCLVLNFFFLKTFEVSCPMASFSSILEICKDFLLCPIDTGLAFLFPFPLLEKGCTISLQSSHKFCESYVLKVFSFI